MSFLQDYVYYSSGTECPEEYTWWGGLSILGHVLGHKVWVEHGDYFRFPPNLFIALVGDAGSGKNTSLGVNFDIMWKHFPLELMSASVQSREDIAGQMVSVDGTKTWQDTTGAYGPKDQIYEYHPFYILNNELSSFLSVDKEKMVKFLVEVYDGKHFSTGFKKDRRENPGQAQHFPNPHVSFLAGAVPTFFMSNLKVDLFSLGLGRRLIIVNAKKTKCIPIPKKPDGAQEAMDRVIKHLKICYEFKGKVTLDEAAVAWWNKWYVKHFSSASDDPILNQFHQTEHMQVLKLALNLRCCELPLGHTMGVAHLEMAVELLRQLKGPIVELTRGMGTNELAGVAQQVIQFIVDKGGFCREKAIQMNFYKLCKDGQRGYIDMMQHLAKTELIYITRVTMANDPVEREWVFTWERWEQYKAAKLEQQAKSTIEPKKEKKK